MLKTLPKLQELYDLINRVPRYPITARQLVDFAASNNASSAVINFYQGFANDLTFVDEPELAETTKQVEILKQEERNVSEQPPEIFTAPEED